MRASRCLLVVAVALAGSDIRAQTSSADPVVVFIHGRGQANRPSAELQAAWSDALARGQDAINVHFLHRDSVRYVMYQNLFEDGRDARLCKEGEYATVGLGDALSRVVKDIADAMARVDGIATMVANRFLTDTREYLGTGSIRCAVNRRLLEEVTRETGRPIILVAHSMGGLIALTGC